MIITIDGPTASGKSTTARLLAERLKIYYLNTGMLYRALAYLLLHKLNYKEEDFRNPSGLDQIIDPNKFIYTGEAVFFDGENITPFLKDSLIDKYASIISADRTARELLLEYQRNFAKGHDLIAEGRDCGSIVFPDATFKFFLTATPEVRAKRWLNFQLSKGNKFTQEEALQKINERDSRDTQRAVSPLVIPKDAFVIDNSKLNQEETIKAILDIINPKERTLG